MTAHQLILPAAACHKFKHRIESRAKQPGPGMYDYCYTCSLGYEMALDALGSEVQADLFVKELRRRP